jgi:hypothetical protein
MQISKMLFSTEIIDYLEAFTLILTFYSIL